MEAKPLLAEQMRRRLWRASSPADFIILGGTIWCFSQIRAFLARVVLEIGCVTAVNSMKNSVKLQLTHSRCLLRKYLQGILRH